MCFEELQTQPLEEVPLISPQQEQLFLQTIHSLLPNLPRMSSSFLVSKLALEVLCI